MPKRVVNAKIALLDMNLQKGRMGLGVHVVIEDPTKLEEIKNRHIFLWVLWVFGSFHCSRFNSPLIFSISGRLRWPRSRS